MRFAELTVQQKPSKRTRRRRAKGREFTVTLLAHVCADQLWELGGAKAERPIWIAYAGPDQTCRAFTANFRWGRPAKAGGDRIEIPKSSPHRWLTERRGESALTVAYLPGLFHLEPAIHPNDITFAFMPPRWWLDQQAEALRGELAADPQELARAALFVAFLDRRSPLPLVQDLRFPLELYRKALDEPWVHRLAPRHAERLEACGLEPPLGCSTTHDAFEQFLKDRTTAYFAQEIRDGKDRFRPDRRLLPYPPDAPTQLQLDFATA